MVLDGAHLPLQQLPEQGCSCAPCACLSGAARRLLAELAWHQLRADLQSQLHHLHAVMFPGLSLGGHEVSVHSSSTS